MKVEVKRTPQEQEFVPVTLSIVLHNKAELDALRSFSWYNVSIPDLAASAGHITDTERAKVQDIFGDVSNKLRGI